MTSRVTYLVLGEVHRLAVGYDPREAEVGGGDEALYHLIFVQLELIILSRLELEIDLHEGTKVVDERDEVREL